MLIARGARHTSVESATLFSALGASLYLTFANSWLLRECTANEDLTRGGPTFMWQFQLHVVVTDVPDARYSPDGIRLHRSWAVLIRLFAFRCVGERRIVIVGKRRSRNDKIKIKKCYNCLHVQCIANVRVTNGFNATHRITIVIPYI